MPSRLLIRFDAEIGSATNQLDADCLRAQRAGYLARLGQFDAADAELAALHARNDAAPRARLSAWINLAEGLRAHYTDLGELARDKLRRAHAISSAGRLMPLQAQSAAWLAHVAHWRMEVDGVVHYAGEALRLAAPDDHAARSRACLVVARSFDEAGRADLARPWFERGHRHATTEGDDATLSSMLWNRAAAGLAQLRQQACLGVPDPGAADRVRLSAESSERLDAGLGIQSLQALHPVLRARLLTETGAHAKALALFEAKLDDALAQGMGGMAAALLADQAWCRVQVGSADAALADARLAEARLNDAHGSGKRAPAHSRLVEVFGALDRPDDAARHAQFAMIAWQELVADQARMLTALGRLTPEGVRA